jgi:hypothetical protein
MTRAIALWILLAVVVLAGALLARRRGIGPIRFMSAWVLSSVLLWACAGVLGYAGARITASSDARAGIAVGTPLGALLGAPLGIALSERGLRDAWPSWRGLLLAAVGLVAAVAIFLVILTRAGPSSEAAGRSVFIVYPLLGAAAVLGWLVGERK